MTGESRVAVGVDASRGRGVGHRQLSLASGGKLNDGSQLMAFMQIEFRTKISAGPPVLYDLDVISDLGG